MLFHLKKFQLSERQGVLAALFVSFVLGGCSMDVAALASSAGNAMQTNTGSIVSYGVAGGSLFLAAGHVLPTVQRFASAMALCVGAFFIGNLSPQMFPPGFADDGPLIGDIPDILVITLLCVAGLLMVFNNFATSRKLADTLNEDCARPWGAGLDQKVQNHSTVVSESLSPPVNSLDFSQDALVVVNAEGVILEFNRKTEFMFGWTREHLIGQHIGLLIPDYELAAGRAGPVRSVVRYLATRSETCEWLKLRGIRKNGVTFSAEVSLSPGRSSGDNAVIATIRTASEPVQVSAALRRSEFARSRIVDTTELGQAEQQRHAVYATLERRLTDLINDSTPIHKVSKGEQPKPFIGAETSPSPKFPECRFDHTAVELADIQWAENWASAEKNARASALSMLRVIDDMHKLPEIDGRTSEVNSSSAALVQRIEDLCNRLFPTSRITSR